ncbi:hypothetical protein TNCV_796911 [Trichonephila clavipes]|uniref:Uncharacterized protein n=1 Tax=Trichonephila clavipes TaxID=2585209 RepID=A0A8X6WJB7_TRICX|nr:hypothetical protein TNCV_796911 [Trichonephila clavipes]
MRGQELMTGTVSLESCKFVPLVTRYIEDFIHVKSVEAQRAHICVGRKFERVALVQLFSPWQPSGRGYRLVAGVS